MPQVVYVNGQYVPRCLAVVSIEDRGYQFADGVYQVMALIRGKFIDEEAHLDALDYSLREIDMDMPMGRGALKAIVRRVVAACRVQNAHIYIQVTRGTQKRTHVYDSSLEASLVIVATPCNLPDLLHEVPEIRIITLPDNRWARPDIKSLALLPNILTKKQADKRGAYDAWQVKGSVVTESGSSNAWIVNQKGELQTHPNDGSILNGVTRQTLIRLARENDIPVCEKPFTPEEAKSAAEAFISASFSLIKAVTHIDDLQIGSGTVGPVTKKLARIYSEYIYG